MFRILLIAAILLPLAPATAAESCPPEAADTSVAYATTGGARHTGVRVLTTDLHEEIFLWPNGASGDVWLETNGLEGLQTAASPCGPADTRLAGASAGLGRPAIIA